MGDQEGWRAALLRAKVKMAAVYSLCGALVAARLALLAGAPWLLCVLAVVVAAVTGATPRAATLSVPNARLLDTMQELSGMYVYVAAAADGAPSIASRPTVIAWALALLLALRGRRVAPAAWAVLLLFVLRGGHIALAAWAAFWVLGSCCFSRRQAAPGVLASQVCYWLLVTWPLLELAAFAVLVCAYLVFAYPLNRAVLQLGSLPLPILNFLYVCASFGRWGESALEEFDVDVEEEEAAAAAAAANQEASAKDAAAAGAPAAAAAAGTPAAAAAAPAARKRCAACGATRRTLPLGEKLRSCGRCRSVHYCSKACQHANWEEHKDECRRLRRLACADLGSGASSGGA